MEDVQLEYYQTYREKIKSGDLLVWSSAVEGGASGLLLNTIRFFTVSEYAHVGIAMYIGTRLCVVEATIPRICLIPVSSKESFYHIPMSVEWSKDVEESLIEYLGLDYSIREAIKAYFKLEVKEDDKWQCAELANRFYKKLGLDFGDNHTPSTLVKTILSKGYNIRLINTES